MGYPYLLKNDDKCIVITCDLGILLFSKWYIQLYKFYI